MKIGFLPQTLAIALVIMLLVGGLLSVWASFQAYDSLSQRVDLLAPDGKLDYFTEDRFESLVLPFKVSGFGSLGMAALLLVFWRKTRSACSRIVTTLLEVSRELYGDAKRLSGDLYWKAMPKLDRMALVVFTLLAILPRVSEMNSLFRHDESYTYIAFASGSLWNAISDYHLPNNHVLLSVILNLTANLVGNQPWMLRLPTVLFGIMVVPATYLVAKKLFSRETAILSGLLVALFPEMIKHSTSARGYILLALIAVLVAGLAAYARTKKNRFAWLLLALFSALGFYTIPIMLLPFGGLFLWLFLSALVDDFGSSYSSRFDFLKHWFLAGMGAALLTILLYSPILLTDADSLLNNSFVVPLDPVGFPSVLRSRLINTWEVWSRDIEQGWLVMIGVIGVALGLLFHRWVANHKIPMQATFLIWIAALIILRRPNAEPRFWFYLVPFLLVWGAAGIGGGTRWLAARINAQVRQSTLLGLSVAALLAVNLWTIPSIPNNWTEVTHLELAVSYLKEQVREGDLVVVGSANGPMVEYQFRINDIPAEYVRHKGPYRRAFVVVALGFGETLESVVKKFGPADPELDMAALELVGQFGNYQIYEGTPSR